MAVIVLDASVVIGYLSAEDTHHQAAAQALEKHADDDLHLPASAYAEVLIRPLREGRLQRARAEIDALLLSVDPIDAPTAEAAADLRARFSSLRLPDALVVARGDVIDADAVLTTDERWRRVSRRVDVVR